MARPLLKRGFQLRQIVKERITRAGSPRNDNGVVSRGARKCGGWTCPSASLPLGLALLEKRREPLTNIGGAADDAEEIAFHWEAGL